MNCKACGTTLTTEQKFCPVCGTAVEEETVIQEDVAAKMSEQEFAKYPSVAPMCSKISTAVGLYGVSAIITAVMILITRTYSSLIDIGLLILLAVWLHMKKSRVCAVIMAIYGVLNFVLMTMQNGKASGYLGVIAAYCAVAGTFQYQAAWKKYQSDGELPPIKSRKTK